MLAGQSNGSVAGRGAPDLVPAVGEQPREQLTHRGIVVDDEDPIPVATRPTSRGVGAPVFLSRAETRLVRWQRPDPFCVSYLGVCQIRASTPRAADRQGRAWPGARGLARHVSFRYRRVP